MSWNQIELRSSSYTDLSYSTSQLDISQKQVEIYAFVDPLCPECWSLEPYFKKLSIEYGQYFTLRPIISRHLSVLTKDHLQTLKKMWHESAKEIHLQMMENIDRKRLVLFPWVALAIKAAELQGKNAGRVFLRKIQEMFFLKRKNITSEAVLIRCAEEAKLDIQEFKNDLFSTSAKNAYQGDLRITKEMGVHSSPTLVLFNQITDEHGVKISGTYTYETYIQILTGMLRTDLKPAEKSSLEDFLATYHTVTSHEVSIVYDWPLAKAIQELKKLQIQRKAIEVKEGNTSFWQYNTEAAPL